MKNDMSFLIGIAAALVSGLISYGFGRKQQKDQYNLQSSLMTQQAGLNREQYDYEYQKESPAQRMQQYMEAGLNPALMYSNGVAGMQGSVSGVSGSSVGIPNLSNLFDLSENMLDISSSREKEGKTDPAKVEMEWRKSMAALTNSELVGQDLANKWQEFENKWKDFDTNLKIKYSPEEWDLKIKTMREDLANLKADTISLMNDNSLFGRKRVQLDNAIKIQEQTYDNLVAQKDLFVEQTKTESSKRFALESQGQRDLSQADWNDVRRVLDESFGNKERSLSIEKVEEEISKLRSDVDLVRSLTELNDKRTEYTEKDFYLRVGTLILNALHGRRSNNITEQHYKNTDNKSGISVENVISLGRILLPYLLKAV